MFTPCLKRLILSSNKIGDRGLKVFAQSCVQLTRLDELGIGSLITDYGVACFADSCLKQQLNLPSLRTLNISGPCSNSSTNGMQKMVQACKQGKLPKLSLLCIGSLHLSPWIDEKEWCELFGEDDCRDRMDTQWTFRYKRM